ncbi:MAG: hypothetical protein H6811_07020 [Phycisphaeraceae bacterium]|nr:hypothetical protein [Phycisphaeraceae bacterium]
MQVTMTERQRILIDTTIARDKAQTLLRGLLDAKARSEKHLRDSRQIDAMKTVTGRSSMDNAIASTQRMVEALNRAIDQAKRDLSEEDLALLDDVLDERD